MAAGLQRLLATFDAHATGARAGRKESARGNSCHQLQPTLRQPQTLVDRGQLPFQGIGGHQLLGESVANGFEANLLVTHRHPANEKVHSKWEGYQHSIWLARSERGGGREEITLATCMHPNSLLKKAILASFNLDEAATSGRKSRHSSDFDNRCYGVKHPVSMIGHVFQQLDCIHCMGGDQPLTDQHHGIPMADFHWRSTNLPALGQVLALWWPISGRVQHRQCGHGKGTLPTKL